MKILTINVGSSSVRVDLFEARDGEPRRLGSHHGGREGQDAAARVRSFASDAHCDGVDAVAHRFVHGGARLVRPCIVDDAIEREIESLAQLAPLHNPAALHWLRACREALGDHVPQVAVFDTAFFASLPPVASTYALPRALVERHGLKRYGFHGLAHEGMWRRWRDLREPPTSGARIVTLQLGAGCSIAAIRDGLPLDTSMGYSPIEGLVMATRSGDVDPGLLIHLQRAESLSPEQLETLLNEESGLHGISGAGGDMRDLLASRELGPSLAVAVYCHRVRKYLAGYLGVLGGADAIVFGGGVGANSHQIRARVLDDMHWAGIVLDHDRNARVSAESSAVHAAGSKIRIHVLPADEAVVLAETASALVPDPTSRSKH
jgi:acetate kinase